MFHSTDENDPRPEELYIIVKVITTTYANLSFVYPDFKVITAKYKKQGGWPKQLRLQVHNHGSPW